MNRIFAILVICFVTNSLYSQSISNDGTFVCPGTTLSHTLNIGGCMATSVFTDWTITGAGNTIDTELLGIDDRTISVTWNSTGVLTCEFSLRLGSDKGCPSGTTLTAVATVRMLTSSTLNISSSIPPGNLCANQGIVFSSTSPCIGCVWEISENAVNFSPLEIEDSSPALIEFNIENSYSGVKYNYATPYYFRLRKDICPNVTSYSPVVGTYLFYPAAPTIDMALSHTNKPTCPGSGSDVNKFENGSIDIYHGSITLGETFIYTVEQWVPNPSNSSDCSAVPNLPGTDVFNFGTDTVPNWYCKGYIANFSNLNGSVNFLLHNGNKLDDSDANFKFGKGKYSVIVESKKAEVDTLVSCPSGQYFFDIEDPPIVSVSALTGTAPSCAGGNNGSVAFNISGGQSNYSWVINPGNLTGTATATGNVTPPDTVKENVSYTVTVTDGCSNTAPQAGSVTVTVPNSLTTLTLNSPSKQSPTCGPNGSFTIGVGQIGSSTSGYEYYLYNRDDPDSVLSSTTSGLTSTFNGLNDYVTYRVKASIFGCTAQADIKLDSIANINGSVSAVDNKCYGGSDGQIIFTKTTGSNSLGFQLKQGLDPFADVSPVAGTTYNFGGLPGGAYTLQVTDNCLDGTSRSNKKSKIFNHDVTSPTDSLIFYNGGDNVFDGREYKLSCYDGTQDVVVGYQHGTAPFLIELYSNNALIGSVNTSQQQTTFSGLEQSPDNYSIKVTDVCNATIELSFRITSSATTPLTATITKLYYDNNNDGITGGPGDFNLTCPERDDGRLQITVKGGVPGTSPRYAVEVLNVNNPVGTISDVVDAGDSVIYTIGNLAESIDYTVKVTDFNPYPGGCIKTFPGYTLNSPVPLAILTPDLSADFTNLKVYNGSLYAICKGDANGTYTAHVTGGNPTYIVNLFKKSSPSDSWPITPFQTIAGSTNNATFTSLGAGYYKVEVTDQQNCAFTAQTFEIKEADSPIQVDNITAQVYAHGANTKCYGSSDGSIQVDVSGGVGDYTYILLSDDGYNSTITKSAPSHTFSNLPAIKANGDTIIYTISLKDALGCVWQGGTPVSEFKKLTPPAQVKFYHAVVTGTFPSYEIPCKGDSAIVRFTSEGGKYPHYVTIGATIKKISSPTSWADFILPAGNYTAAFNDTLGCTAPSQDFELREPASHIAITVGTITPPVCIGGIDGEINLSATGGIQGIAGEEYVFELNSATYDGTLKGTNVKFLAPANDFSDQEYLAIGTDAHGCTDQTTLTMPVNPTPLTLDTIALVPPSCYGGNNGYIQLKSKNHTYNGGGQLLFKLSGGHLGNSIAQAVVVGDVYTFMNLESTDLNGYGPYKAWVEDANACVDTAYQYKAPLVLPSYEPLKLDLLKSIRPSCYNGSDGSLYLHVSGGVVPYQYSRDNITYYPVPADSNVYTNQLTAGQYTFYLKDANYVPDQPTCLNTTSFEVPLGRALRLETVISNISCKGGSDGSIDLTVNLDNRDTNEIFNLNRLSLSWVNNNVSSLPFSTVEDISSLTRGTYTVKANYNADSLVCTQQKTVNVLEPSSAFRITEVKTYDASCGGYANGKAVVTWAGGWTNSISYYKLDNGAWQPMSSSSFVLTGLAVGSHQVAIAQKNFECTDSKIFEITSSPLALTVGEIFKPSCPQFSDGAVVLSSTGSGVEYAFENGAFQLLSSFTGLAAGTYRFVARKANDPACSSATVEAILTDPDDCGNGPLALTILSTSVATCNTSSDGNAQALANGGVPPYRYYWDGNSTEGTTIATSLAVGGHTVTVKDAMDITKTASFEITAYAALSTEPFTSLTSCATTCDGTAQLVVTGGSSQYIITWTDGATGDIRTDLCVGTYSYTITDAADNTNTCSITGAVTIDHYQSLTLSEQNAVAPICPGGTDGYVSVEADGGSGQYQLQWANQSNSTGKVTTLSGVVPGTYTLTVTDNVLGCTLSENFNIPNALPITVTSTDITPPSCYGGTNGRIVLTLSNAISPLVQWSDGQLGLQATNLKAGTYQYSITSALGCSITGSATVTDRPELQVSSATVVPTCFGLCNGEASLTITGGTAPYAITWAHGPKTLTTKSLCAGTYSYTVSDKFSCTINSSVVITAPDPVTITLLSKEDVSCNDGTDGKLEASATGGTGTLTYLWNTGSKTSTLSDVGAGSYSLSVSDDNACTARKTYTITEPALLLFKDEKIINPSCPGLTDGQIATSGKGGTAPYQYQWTDQFNGSSRTGLSAGDYTVTVTDSKGCEIIKKYVLSPPAPLEIVNVTKTDPSCTSYKDGHISVQAIGGVSPYSFSWGNGSTQASITALPAGTYSVTVNDKNNCTITGSYTLTDPVKPVITGIAAKTVICTGSTAALQPNGEWSRYEWTSPQGKIVTTERYETGVLGTHTLTAWDQRNCPAETSFIIEVSDNALTADFLRLSEPIAFQPVVFVDISEPVPTAVEWLLPPDVVVNRMNNEMIEVVFIDSGSYEIGMKATHDRCQSELYKIVEVKEQNNPGANSGGEDEEKLDVIVYPNPAADQLNVQVASDSRNEVVLRLLTSLENRQVVYESLEGQFDYLVSWDVSTLTPGVFFLVYEQNGKIYSKRVLVVR